MAQPWCDRGPGFNTEPGAIKEEKKNILEERVHPASGIRVKDFLQNNYHQHQTAKEISHKSTGTTKRTSLSVDWVRVRVKTVIGPFLVTTVACDLRLVALFQLEQSETK